MMTLDRTRPGVAAMAVGVARAAMEFAIDYSKERVQFGVPIAMHQAIQFIIADMATKVHLARLATWNSAVLLDQGRRNTLESSHAKRFAADTAMEVTTDAVQVYGGYGFIKEYKVEKLMRDAKILQLYEGTAQIQRLVIARETLLPRRVEEPARGARVDDTGWLDQPVAAGASRRSSAAQRRGRCRARRSRVFALVTRTLRRPGAGCGSPARPDGRPPWRLPSGPRASAGSCTGPSSSRFCYVCRSAPARSRPAPDPPAAARARLVPRPRPRPLLAARSALHARRRRPGGHRRRTIRRTICRPGYTKSVRPPESMTRPEKLREHDRVRRRRVAARLRVRPPDLARAGRRVERSAQPVARARGQSATRRTASRTGCTGWSATGRLRWPAAQRQIATDWVTSYRRLFGVIDSLTSGRRRGRGLTLACRRTVPALLRRR